MDEQPRRVVETKRKVMGGLLLVRCPICEHRAKNHSYIRYADADELVCRRTNCICRVHLAQVIPVIEDLTASRA